MRELHADACLVKVAAMCVVARYEGWAGRPESRVHLLVGSELLASSGQQHHSSHRAHPPLLPASRQLSLLPKPSLDETGVVGSRRQGVLRGARPEPAVSLYTRTSMLLTKPSMAYAHPGLNTALLEPYNLEHGVVRDLLDVGSDLSEFQALDSMRKQAIFKWSVAPDTSYHLTIVLLRVQPLDELIYAWLVRNGSICDFHVIVKTDGFLGRGLIVARFSRCSRALPR